MTITRRQMLWGALAGAAALQLPRIKTLRAAPLSSPKNLLMLFARGGWDTTYSIDPKPGLGGVDAPAGTVQRFGDLDILTDPSRPGIANYFASYGDITAVVRGVSVRSIAHAECSKRIFTGSGQIGRPDIASALAYQGARDLPLPYLMLGRVAFAGPYASLSGRVGKSNQLSALINPGRSYDVVGSTGDFAPSNQDRQAVRDFLKASAERERAVRGSQGYNKARIDDFVDSQRYARLVRSNAQGFGAPGQALGLRQQAQLAAQVLEEGISRAASLDAGPSFDTHNTNVAQGAMHDQLFADLKFILDDLKSRPGASTGATLLDETVLYVVSEMGRTPKINGDQGKDHWPVTSAMIIGTEVPGGRAYGGTSNRMEAELCDLASGEVASSGSGLQTSTMGASVLSLCGVDPAENFPGVEPLHALLPQ